MSLPDLDKTEVSFIAWWNFLDNGASSIDPTETESVFASSTLYSNGIEGVFDPGFNQKTRNVNARVKDDGWLIAWFDRTAEEDFPDDNDGEQKPDGPYDFAPDWTAGGGGSLDDNQLVDAISQLKSALSNSGAATLNPGDVSLYNFEYEKADNITFAYAYDGNTMTLDVGSGTTLYAGWAYGTNGSGKNTEVQLADGTVLRLAGDSQDGSIGDQPLGSIELVSSGRVSAGEAYDVTSANGARSSSHLLWA